MTHAPVPFDPEIVPAMDAVRERMPPLTLESIPDRRAVRAAMLETLPAPDLTIGGTYEAVERAVPGPDGAPDVPLLITRPRAATAPTPVVYLIHGGGMVLGREMGLIDDDWLARAAELGLALVSVDYRTAPENPYPAPLEDCYAGLLWTAAHADELNVDPARIVLAGGSAGAGLAAGTALLARDRGGPTAAGQFLACPMLDDRDDTVSAAQMDGRGVWDRATNVVGWTAYLGERRGGPDVPAYAAPARATDLSGLPPAYVDVGSAETFRDEAVAYASALWAAGGDCELHVWPGGFHGFTALAPGTELHRRANAEPLPWLRRVLGAG